MTESPYGVRPIGWVRSPLTDRAQAPKQGDEGGPDAWLEFDSSVRAALGDLRADADVLLLTWLDRADREVLTVHPRGDQSRPETGVFSTSRVRARPFFRRAAQESAATIDQCILTKGKSASSPASISPATTGPWSS